MKNKFVHFEGAMALLASAFIYGTFGILIREIAKMMGDATQTLARFALAAVFALGLNLVLRNRLRAPRGVLIRAGLLGALFAAVVVLFTISANNTKIANSVVLLYAGSILSSFIFGSLAFKEKITAQKIAAIMLALVGLSMYSSGLMAASAGLLAGFASGLFDGAANSIRKTLKSVNRNLVIMYSFTFGSLFTLLIVMATGGFEVGAFSWLPVILTVVFAILQIFLNNLLLFGFQHFDVNVGTVILATELFFASLLGYLFFRESPTTPELVGGIVIFASSIVASVNFTELLKVKKSRRKIA